MYIFSILYGNREAGTKNTLYKDLKREGGDSRDESSCREAPRTKKELPAFSSSLRKT